MAVITKTYCNFCKNELDNSGSKNPYNNFIIKKNGDIEFRLDLCYGCQDKFYQFISANNKLK